MKQIVIHKSKRKAALATAAGFLLGIGGGMLILYGDDPVIGWCLVLAAGFTLLYGIGSTLDRRQQIVLTERGITERFTIREEIEWEAILHTDDFWFRGQYFVRLLLERSYKPEMIRPTWFRRFDRIYGKEGVKAVYIRTSGLEINSMQLASLIRKMVGADPIGRIVILKKYASRRE